MILVGAMQLDWLFGYGCALRLLDLAVGNRSGGVQIMPSPNQTLSVK